MPDHAPEPWESSASGPFLTIAGGRVQVWALGSDRFRVIAPGHEREIAGHDAAVQAAQGLAEQLDA
jgi:hypothetical protein